MSQPCPTCKQETRVKDSRFKPNEHIVIRRYHCQNRACNRKFSTYEIIISEAKSAIEAYDRLRMTQAKLEEAIDIIEGKIHPCNGRKRRPKQ